MIKHILGWLWEVYHFCIYWQPSLESASPTRIVSKEELDAFERNVIVRDTLWEMEKQNVIVSQSCLASNFYLLIQKKYKYYMHILPYENDVAFTPLLFLRVRSRIAIRLI